MTRIESLHALEILDSRGRPTIKVTCRLAGGIAASASVPSGASTGLAEAVERRDGDPHRHNGLGCRTAVANVESVIHPAATNHDFPTQAAWDQFLIALDGTPNKAQLGANAILGCSLAFARAVAARDRRPLYETFRELAGIPPLRLPRLSVNLFSGGKHAGGQVPIQDVLLVPVSPTTVDDSLTMICEIYRVAAEWCHTSFGMRLLTADEGGLSPPVANSEALFEAGREAIARAGLSRDVRLAVDVAASHFESAGEYRLDGRVLSGDEMVERLQRWVGDFDLLSVEDGLGQDDWPHWTRFRERVSGRSLVIGDDLLCTNPARIRRAIDARAADTLLLKVNQIGTLTEAAEANRLAREAGWSVVISARSGETEDDWLADLAVGWSGDFIKVGSVTQSERLAKYNRLLEIERESGLTIPAWNAPAPL